MTDVAEPPVIPPPTTRTKTRLDLIVRLLTMAMIALLLVFAVIVVAMLTRPKPFDRIEFSTTIVQAVTDGGIVVIPQIEGLPAPSVYIDEPVPLFFEFCVSGDDEFAAIGNSWAVVDATGQRFPINQGIVSQLRPGCITPRTTLELPAQMRVTLQDLASGLPANAEPVLAHFEGDLTPDVDGGVTAYWESERFFVVPTREGQ